MLEEVWWRQWVEALDTPIFRILAVTNKLVLYIELEEPLAGAGQ